MRWYDQFAEAVGDARVVIAFEPDSLGTIDCLASRRAATTGCACCATASTCSPGCPTRRSTSRPAPPTGSRPARTAKQLRAIGVSKVRGFMLNVTHHDWTRYNVQHGLEISRLVGGKHFIVNTSYNGRGPVHYRRWINRSRHIWRTINVWCHPGLRGLGPAADDRHLEPARGRVRLHQPPRLLGRRLQRRTAADRHLVARARADVREVRDQLGGTAAGTRYGHYRRYSLRALGAFN